MGVGLFGLLAKAHGRVPVGRLASPRESWLRVNARVCSGPRLRLGRRAKLPKFNSGGLFVSIMRRKDALGRAIEGSTATEKTLASLGGLP